MVVTGSNGDYHYCGPHHFDALSKALVTAHQEGTCGFHFPPIGDFVITSAAKPSEAPSGERVSPS